MEDLLFVATADGLAICDHPEGGWREIGRGLAGHTITCVSAGGATILAGTNDGIRRSEDAGQSWQEANQGLSIRHTRWLAHHPSVAGLAFVGTEPAGIFGCKQELSGRYRRPSQLCLGPLVRLGVRCSLSCPHVLAPLRRHIGLHLRQHVC